MTVFPHVVCLQMEIKPGDIAANLESCKKLLADCLLPENGLIVLPELWATGFDYSHVSTLAEETPCILDELQQVAEERKIWFAGSLLETRQQGRPSNTLFLTGPEGVQGKYRKHHLFSFWQEDEYLQPGRSLQPMVTPFGRVGAMICYDLRFPEIGRAQSFAGAPQLVVSAQWPAVRLDQWESLVRARAVENQAFVAACNGCGAMEFGDLAGHSMIIAPDGTVLARGGTSAGAVAAALDEKRLAAVRSRFCSAGERPWSGYDGEKFLGVAELRAQLGAIRRQGSRIVFTNGCFDLLHAGHVSYLEQARACGDCLVVGLNSDRSVRALKGASRPINSEQDRARVLAALGCVDYVVLFDEDTPQRLIADLLPDVLVKGADWAENEIAGAAEVKAAGGRVERIVFEHQLSTTAVVEKIRQRD